ncbi:magnesium transporter [Heyndrickxia vini]|uniref:Magnesium transporter MgtE n=1 Tax=Heyndrickxia vini TaxID=1476025 RepID=A0ABX7DYQ9_9BACI|nr:magnesium transporter [Heyndrickxia vini]QQZ08200.1 magnesium transporter [Heyndrickxia vini]
MGENLEDQKKLHQQILLNTALENKDIHNFRDEFLSLHPYDQARFFIEIDPVHRKQVYYFLSPKEMAFLFEQLEIEDEEYRKLLSEMLPQYAADVLSYMFTDNAVDVLNILEKDQVASYLTMMDQGEAQEIKDLLHYEEYTAGSIMTTEYVAIEASQTVRSAMFILKNEAAKAEMIYYLYVIDEEKRLVGVLSLRDLIIEEDDTMITEIMNDRVVYVSVSDDQEDIARRMKDYNFLAIPVVDFQRHLLGIITIDDIVDVIDEEASEDYSKLAAVSDMDSPSKSPFSAAKKRLPWLIVLLFLGMFTASLIGRFEDTLKQVALLAVFIPLIGGMAGNTGTQALAVAVRGIATGDVNEESKWKLILREAGTGFITGATCGILIMIIVYVWKGELFLGLLVGISILASLVVATMSGSLIPLLMDKLNIDPAVASGPFITTINDIISILIYFGMANLFMNHLI